MIVYKFKDLHGDGLLHALDIIVNKRIYLSTCDSMNDVEEGTWDVEPEEAFKDGFLEVAKKLRKIVDSIRFTSFTAKSTDVLFWAHYAGGFSGVTFEFNLNENKHDIREIKYDGKPSLSLDTMQKVIDKEVTAMGTDILVSKSESWVNEKEYRLFHEVDSQKPYFEIEPNKIIFGLKDKSRYDILRKVARKYDLQVSYLSKNHKDEFCIVDS